MDMIESYTLKYNFGEWNARIKKYLNRLLSKSTDYFANQFNNGELEDTNSEYVTMLESIFNIEEYLYYNKNNIKKFNEYHQKTGISFTRLINSAIKEFFENI